MAATKKPGIKKAGPRSSKVVPITPREIRQAVVIPERTIVSFIKPVETPLTSFRDNPRIQQPDSLRQKLANWLESFARWVRA